MSRFTGVSAAFIVLFGVALVLSASAALAQGPGLVNYRVTIQNLSANQPLSPPVAATHQKSIRMFQVSRFASDELAAIAQDGNQVPMADKFRNSNKVTQVVDVGQPLTRKGTTVGTFTDSATFEIQAAPGDKLSLATMLICTNDGITGLDAVNLPQSGTQVHLANGYDAGREPNTELSQDLVDPCSALGSTPLPGDPNGNQNPASNPTQPIHHHPGITGGGHLSVAAHGWTDPVVRVTVTRLP